MNTSFIHDCGDSSLSKASNITSLLTFVLASLLSYVAYQESTISAFDEIEKFREELARTKEQLREVLKYWKDAQYVKEDVVQNCAQGMQKSLSSLLEIIKSVNRELTPMTRPPGPNHGRLDFQIRRRYKWLKKRQYFHTQMVQVRNIKDEIMFSQLHLLTQYVTGVVVWIV